MAGEISLPWKIVYGLRRRLRDTHDLAARVLFPSLYAQATRSKELEAQLADMTQRRDRLVREGHFMSRAITRMIEEGGRAGLRAGTVAFMTWLKAADLAEHTDWYKAHVKPLDQLLGEMKALEDEMDGDVAIHPPEPAKVS